MSEFTSSLRVRSSWLTRVAPWLLWLLVLAVPMLLGRILLLNALEVDKKIWLASTKQMLMNESQKYKTLLSSEFFVDEAMEKKTLHNIYTKHFRLEMNELEAAIDFDPDRLKYDLHNHPILKKLPWHSKNVKNELPIFLSEVRRRIGIDPALIYCLGEDSHSRFIMGRPPFSLLTSPEEFDAVLLRAHRFWKERLRQGIKRESYFGKFNTVPELAECLGYFLPPSTDIFAISDRFSSRTCDRVFHMMFRFQDYDGKEVFLNLIFRRGDLKWRDMIRRVQASSKSSAIKQSFGYSDLQVLPQIIEDEHKIDYIFELPSEFRKIYLGDPQVNQERRPVFKLSVQKNRPGVGIFSKASIDFFFKIFLLISLLIPVGLEMGQLRGFRSLKALMATALFAGAFVPVLGLIWLSSSFVNSQKYFEAEKIFARMELLLDEIEKKMLLQIYRNEVYYNLLAYRIDSQSLAYPDLLESTLKRFSNHRDDFDREIGRPIIGYYLLNREGQESMEVKARYLANILQIKPFFSGSFCEMLLEMGSFDHLSNQKRQEIEQKAQLALGMTEQLNDRQLFQEVSELERTRVSSTISPRQEFFTGFFLDRKSGKPGGVLVVYGDNGDWVSQLQAILNLGIFPCEYFEDGYKMNVGFFRLDKVNLAKVSHLEVRHPSLSNYEQAFLGRLGLALFANSGNHRINNLTDDPANIILARVIANQNFFAVVYGERKSGIARVENSMLAILVILIALMSSGALALAVARIMLMSLPAFSTAIDLVQHRDYLWQIELNSGDELERLADSFNQMGRKLLEREKMSQLVSENVMEVVSAGSSEMLRPGGEKRYAAILFSDIRGFTSLSEKYLAEEIVDMLNQYFTDMAEIIVANGGIIDKLIGDAIQAVFYQREGIPSAEERACCAALAMKERLKAFNRKRRDAFKFEVNNGVGIASGMVIAGRVGSETGKLDATVLGSTLKLAESLEAKSKFALKTNILIDLATAEALSKNRVRHEICPFQSQGENETIFELVRLE